MWEKGKRHRAKLVQLGLECFHSKRELTAFGMGLHIGQLRTTSALAFRVSNHLQSHLLKNQSRLCPRGFLQINARLL